ncbi:MAG TPA: family 78 glycoside hydrolase catalytic domain [Opitutaceae bacterium]|nr:family 78 glycoside hydrolase catalytic domain [Opitutaceae bacterium]
MATKTTGAQAPIPHAENTVIGGANSRSSLMVPGGQPNWTAHYAWSRERGGPGLTVCLFRLVFDGHEVADGDALAAYIIHVTADSRYRLWLNGAPLGFGPAKGSLARYHFETYTLGALLRPGKNILAAEVRFFGENSPVSEVHSPVPGFVVQGPSGAGMDTPGNWKVLRSQAVTPDRTAYIENAHQFLDHMDREDLRLTPRGWREVEFEDAAWESAQSTGPAAAVGAIWGVKPMRNLTPRDIPALLEERRDFQRVIRDHRVIENPFGETPRGIEVAPGQSLRVLLDAGQYMTGFPELAFSGGEGREVRVLYAEALGRWVAAPDGKRKWLKSGVRDDLANEPHGYRDTVILGGGETRWEPFYWRAFRFIEIEILAGGALVTLQNAQYRLCVYPQKASAAFASSDARSEQIWTVSQHTYRIGAHEIYDDSPYFEQLSYIADTRLEALGSMYLCNETRLPRRTLQLFLDTLRADGLIDARVPCQYGRQTIPYFCLHWILMVEDYWKWVGDADGGFVRDCMMAVDTILLFFRRRLRPDGFVGVTGGWNMVDVADEWPNGEPPSVTQGGSTYLTCLFVEALRAANRLHGQAGLPADGLRWLVLADQLQKKIAAAAWDEAAGLFRESVDSRGDRFSQHTQAGAINAGVADARQMGRILERLCSDAALIQTNSMQSFYLTRALAAAQAFDQWHGVVLQPWREALDKHLTTWPEYPDPTRSDSHAWAAWPAVVYISGVLGIQPGAPGWASVKLAPQVGGLDWAEGEMLSPRGKIDVSWRKKNGRLDFAAHVPDGLPVDLTLPGAKPERIEAGGKIERRLTLR